MKKISLILLYAVGLFVLPLHVFATGNVTVNTQSINLDQGTSRTFNITASNAAGKVTITSSNHGIVTVDKTSEWIENKTITINLKAITVGTAMINVNVNAATFDEEVINKNYVIKVIVNAAKSSNNRLSSITIDGKNYNVSDTIDLGTTTNTLINISAIAEDAKANISGIGLKNINVGNNIYKVTVTAENGDKKIYSIKVIKKDENGNHNVMSSDNTLELITIDGGYKIDFDPNILEYNIEVENDIDSINISAKPNDLHADYEIIGNGKLMFGNNSVKINVTAENGDKKTYIIYVNRKSNTQVTTIKELVNILDKISTDEVIIEIKDDDTILSEKVLKLMAQSNKKFIINNYNDNLIKYSWIIDGSQIKNINEIDTLINFDSENTDKINKITNYADVMNLNFKHNGILPTGTKIRVYVGNKYGNGEKINIYYYNSKNGLMDKIVNNVEVIDGYVDFVIDHCSEYIITKAELVNSSINIFFIISIIEVIVIITLILFLFKQRKLLHSL